MINVFIKDPGALLDYTIDWSAWLGTDTIASLTWTIPTGLTEHSRSNTSTAATIWLQSGTASVDYEVVNSITTAGGRTDERTIKILVRER